MSYHSKFKHRVSFLLSQFKFLNIKPGLLASLSKLMFLCFWGSGIPSVMSLHEERWPFVFIGYIGVILGLL